MSRSSIILRPSSPHPAIALALLALPPASAGGVRWADRIVFGVHENQPVYEPGLGTPMTFGPFHLNTLWNDPTSILGKPNTLDYDDLQGWGPVPGGFAGGPMRRLSLIYAAWQYGSNDPDHLGQRPGWLDGRRKNGVGLQPGAQVVLEFDPPILDHSDDGGAYHRGADFIVHGNAFFAADRAVTAETNLDAVLLTGGVLIEPVEVSVAQFIEGPWYTFVRTADALFPTQPWRWDSMAGEWTDEELDWGKPVDPALTSADFAGITAAEAIERYNGSAGGTPFDLDWLTDDSGAPASLGWARFVRFRDPLGMQGEICAVAVVPPAGPGSGCNPADLAEPTGVLDLADITAFVGAFVEGEPAADLAPPAGVFDLSDITAFVSAFTGGCP